jgi:hypothetical protein
MTRLSPRDRRLALLGLGAAMVTLTVVLFAIDPKTQGHGDTGIGGFEFAATGSHAQQIVAEWGPEGRRLAKLGLYLDYAYMLCTGSSSRSPGWRRETSPNGRDAGGSRAQGR